MNARKARALRKRIYGDNAQRDRHYEPQMQYQNKRPVPTGALVAVGLRREYQEAKA